MHHSSRLQVAYSLAVLLGTACGDQPAVGIPVSDEVAPTVTRDVLPRSLQGSPDDLSMVDLDGVMSREALTSRVLVYGELTPLDQETMTVLTNTIEAPCKPCQGRTLASCLIEMPNGCENIPELLDRSVRMVSGSSTPNQIRNALTYSDVWLPLPKDDRRVDGVQDGVRLEVWVDPSSASVRPVIDTLDSLDLTGVGVAFRIIPFDESAASRAWSAAAIAAEQQGMLEAFLRGVRNLRDEQRAAQASVQVDISTDDIDVVAVSLIDEGLNKERFDADRGSSEVFVRIDSDILLAKQTELRVAPSWFVDGYRMRGAQSVLAIQKVIVIEVSDLLAKQAVHEKNIPDKNISRLPED